MNLQVKADTAAAQQNLQQLGSLLQEISSSKINLDSGPISQAAQSAQQLQVHLQNAVNVNTGKIDLNKLDASLKASNTNLLTLTTNLQKAGPAGQQAFLKVAQAVSQAEAPLIRVNDKLKNFGVTLLNTIKWQLASNLIHGVQGAIEGAVSHAKDLNSALNDIRIVTGYSSDYMADFTAKASEAAKALNTTTVEYSKAALIFYQQGLTGKDVEDRVSTVIKLSEVTGQSAEQISSQMTAIWNNFDDGSHKLEYYADVITKLGASTASSSAEISNGLQKFAAIADTVGLSYEKAASSLATVVAETRQSEEVIGTAFKTIFARMEGLSLGKTLEDGVDLNKYSKALQTVGVNVLDANGKMKDMDITLDALGKKWKLLGQEQQIALAQTVAGVRQYNQFVSLMDNYDEVLKNEDLAKNSSGTLSKQAEIWSESWEAASKRVQKSQQDLYESIISDKTLIKFEDMFSGLINGVNNFIKSSGGIVPVLASVVGMASSTLFPLLQNGFKQLHNNIKIWSGDAAQDFATMQGALSGQMSQLLDNNTSLSNAERQQIEITQDLINKKTLLTLQSKSMSEAEKIEAQNKIAILEATGNLAKAALERQANAEKELATILKLTDAEEKYRIALSKQMVNLGDSEEDQKKRQILETAQERGRDTSATQQNIQSLEKQIEKPDSSKEKIEQLEKERVQLAQQGDILGASEKAKEIKQITQEIEKQNKELVEQLDIEKQILKAQEEAKKTKINSKNEFGIQDINSYKDKDENDVDLHNTTNEMIGNTIGNNKDLGAGDADTIKISEEAYIALAKAEIEAKMASEDFSAMSTELNTLLATNAEEIEGVNAATVKIATEKRNAAQAAENLAKSASKEANAERLNVQNLKNQLAALKNSKTSHSEIIQVKSKLANAEQKLQNATKKEIKAQQDAKKAMQDLVASTTPAARVFSNVSSNIHEMGTKLGLTKKDLNEFDQKMKQALEQDTAEGKIEAVQAILDELAASSDAAGFAFEQMGLDMQKALSSEGFSPERLGKVKDGIQGAAEATHDAKRATDQYGGSLDENDKKQKKIGSKLTGIATVLGKVTMGYNALKSVVNVWDDDDASLMDKIMTTFTSISMILPLISGEYGILNGVKAINNMLEKTGHSAKIKSLAAWAAEKVATAENTGSTWAYVAAKVAQKIAENGWAGIALGVALVAAIGIAAATISATAATEKNTEAIKKQNEATQENAENTSKAAEKWQEESNTMDDLIKKYRDLKNAQEDVTQTQKDILDQAPALIDSYKELNKTLEGTGIDLTDDIAKLEHAVAAGDAEKVAELKRQIDAKAAQGTAKATEKGATAAMNTTKIKMEDSGANSWGKDGEVGFSSGGYHENEGKAANILSSKLTAAGGTAKTRKGGWQGNKYIVDYQLDTSEGHEDEFIQQYEALLQAKKEMEEQGINEKSDIYKDLNKMLEDTEEEYNKVKELVGDSDTYKIESLASDIDLTEISSYAEYEEKINQLKKEAIADAEKNGELTEEEKKKIEDNVDAWAKGKTVLDDYTAAAEKLKYVEDEHGEAVKNELNEYYKELQKIDPEKAKLFVNVDFSKVASKEALDAQLDYLQSEAKHTKIQADLKVVKEGSDAIKTDGSMTEDDWKKVDAMKSTIESDMGMSYENFLSLDSSSQKAILTNYNKNKRWEGVGAQLIKLAGAQNSVDAFEKQQQDLQNKIKKLQSDQSKFTEEQKTIFKAMDMSENTDYDSIKKAFDEKIAAAEKGTVDQYGRTYEDRRALANEKFTGDAKHDSAVKQAQMDAATMSGMAMESEKLKNELNNFTKAISDDSGALDPAKMKDYQAAYEKYKNLPGEIEKAQGDLQNAQTEYQNALTDLTTAKEDALKTVNDILTSSTSLSELDENIAKIKEYGVDMEDYHSSVSTSLINLASNYENCSEEILNYQQAIASGSEELEAETEAILRNSIAVAELAEALDLEAEAVEEQAKELISVNDLSTENYKVATKVAVLNQSMNKGIKELTDNWETYKDTLKTAQKGTQDYAETALKVKEALAEMLGVLDADYIPDDFLDLPGVMDLIDKAAEGDEAAINALGATMAKSTIDAMEFKEGMVGVATALDENGIEQHIKMTAEQFEGYKNDVLEGIQSLTDTIQNGTLQAGEDITELMDGTTGSWIKSLNEMAMATGMSVDEMNSLLNELGVQADVTTKTKEVETTVPEYATIEKKMSPEEVEAAGGDKNSTGKKSYTTVVGYKKVKGAIEVAQINMGDDAGTPPTITYAGRDNVSTSALTKSDSSSSKSSSSSSSSKTTSAASHTHEVHRYDNEKNAVEGLSDQYERLNKIKDSAFGAGRIQAMELELQKLKQLKKASGDYLDAIVGSGNSKKVAETLYKGGNIGSMISSGELGGTIGSDYRALSSGISASGKNLEYTAKDDAGNQYLVSGNYSLSEFNSMFGSNVNFQLDSYGNLANKDSILNLLNNLQNQENDSYASVADPTAASTTEHNKRLAYLAEMKERIEQYGTTLEDLSTQSEQYLEYISQIQEKNAELITEKLNNGITLSNNTLTRLERAIKILGNDIYKSTEKMAKWFSIKDQNRAEYQKQASLNADAMAEVQRGIELYKQNPLDENAISPAKAAELVKTIEENYANLYEKAVSDIAEKEEKYNEVLENWKTKISDVTTSITFNIEKLDHLQKVFELLGKSTDYKSLGKIFEAQAKGAETNYNVQKAKTDEAKKLYSEHQAHAATLSGTELEEYQKTVLDKDRALLEEFEKEEESAFQSWIEKLQVVHENNINQIYQDYEKALVGEYGSFDNLDRSMERQKSMTEEYLTKTNQLYETNKMLRNLQQDIDKTDSRIAKEKLKNFSDEIEAMRNREKLTKNDLELAKAKYEVVKAQIALEEAQNAKSTVRLQRDNEGNYGYVYTADQDKVSNAEQNLEDKENNYYNIALQQYNDYVEKEMQLRKEYTEQKKALDQAYYEEGSLTLEQYNQACLELDEIFKEKELIYQEGANSRGTLLDQIAAIDRTEAWSSMYEDVALKQSLFNDESTGAAQELNQALQSEMQDWDNTRNQLLEEAGLDNKQFQSTINDVTKEIDSLGNQITKDGGLVDQFDEMAVTTEALTLDFVNQYQALLNEANGYLEAANQASNYQSELALLTQAQLEYNAAVAAQPTANYSGNGNNGYTGNVDGSGDSSGDNNSNTSNGIDNQKKGKTYKRQFLSLTFNYDPKTGRYSPFINYLDTDGKTAKMVGVGTTFGDSSWGPVQRSVPYKEIVKSLGIVGAKTGMYTGSWNGSDIEENGKLAFLHQKELVLNADDTENLLAAVKYIRQISQIIDLQAAQSSMPSIQAAQFSNEGQVLQQEVTIHAEFPNATDHNEIEEAFNNLINKASQYANRY